MHSCKSLKLLLKSRVQFRYIDDPQSLWPGGLSICEHKRDQDDSDSDAENEDEERSDDGQPDDDGDDNLQGAPADEHQTTDDPAAILIYPCQAENDPNEAE